MSDQDRKINIACAFDRNFVIPFYVFLTSIFENNRRHSIIIHTIAEDLDAEEKARITDFVSNNKGKIHFYHIDKERVKQFTLPQAQHISSATYYRFFFPTLIPADVSTLLYLDIDIIVNGDLSELYATDLANHAVGAVSDAKIGARPDLGIDRPEDYFNAGVLLINVPEWESQEIRKKAFEFLISFPEKASWADQDALNYVLAKKWYKLDKKYNVTYYDVPTNLRKKNYQEYIKSKVIIHYTTQNKPWLLSCTNPLNFVYHYYFRLSPQADKKMYADYKVLSLMKFTKIKMKEMFIELIK